MPKPPQRRKVREAVVQVLYATDSVPPASSHDEAVELVMESARTRILHARGKALLHLQQGREKSLGPLAEIVRQIGRLDEALHSEDSIRAIRDLARSEENVVEAITGLSHEMAGNKNPVLLEQFLDRALRANQESRTHLAKLTSPRPGLPAVDATRALAVEVTSALPRYAERLAQCLADDPPELPELAGLRKALAAAAAFRNEVDTMAAGVIGNLAGLDTTLADAVENYAPERIDRVDRAILRLGAYELLHRPDVPTPVVLNEAIELARAFGTTDSPGFVNGVLDKVARARPASQAEGNL